MHIYPAFDSLGIAPDYLTFGRSAMRSLHDYGWSTRPVMPPKVPVTLLETRTPRRAHKSGYVGVTVHRNRWIAQWGPRGCVKSAVYPLDAAGERAAAIARAQALGLGYVELRDGTREAV